MCGIDYNMFPDYEGILKDNEIMIVSVVDGVPQAAKIVGIELGVP